MLSTLQQNRAAAKLFVSYSSPRDERLKEALLRHLTPLSRQGLIESWDIQEIRAGDKRDEEILRHLNEADIILCLLSSHFLSSKYCYSIEMTKALERQIQGEVEVIPVLLRSVYWQETPLRSLQVLPRNEKAIADCGMKKDAVLTEVAIEIERVAIEFLQKKKHKP